MEKPTECKWCGCGDIERESPIMQSVIVTFACGTMSDTDADGTRWLRDQRCAGPVGKLYKRIKRAVEVLEKGERFVDYTVSGEALEILRGNSPGSPDSSPVTADQLAASDYFEAVRQRVPWMTSIEHIEGLIEGYRQCGLMVWKAAEQIKLIFGGGK